MPNRMTNLEGVGFIVESRTLRIQPLKYEMSVMNVSRGMLKVY